ncbi:hypothetical protein HK104_010991 [Borealophlyctis nickersoniae]|nr:hypothetical protein HK104_010991 [Borealophlyctis nickersoniae]
MLIEQKKRGPKKAGSAGSAGAASGSTNAHSAASGGRIMKPQKPRVAKNVVESEEEEQFEDVASPAKDAGVDPQPQVVVASGSAGSGGMFGGIRRTSYVVDSSPATISAPMADPINVGAPIKSESDFLGLFGGEDPTPQNDVPSVPLTQTNDAFPATNVQDLAQPKDAFAPTTDSLANVQGSAEEAPAISIEDLLGGYGTFNLDSFDTTNGLDANMFPAADFSFSLPRSGGSSSKLPLSQQMPSFNQSATPLWQSQQQQQQQQPQQQHQQQNNIAANPFAFGPLNLTIPELPTLPPDFYLHLVSLFFTFFHPTFPVIQERIFFENLVPVNNHHPMLLSAIYAVGCLYSRHPLLYQQPFASPQKASEYFANRAASVGPQFSAIGKGGQQAQEGLSECVASILLACCDYGARRRGKNWSYNVTGCRLAQKLDLAYDETKDDFYSVYNGLRKQQVEGTKEERKRAWWGALLTDCFASISSGSPMIINEADYAETFLDADAFMTRDDQPLSLDPYGNSNHQQQQLSVYEHSHDLWQPFVAGAPNGSVFSDADIARLVGPDPQAIGHLFTPIPDAIHMVQLSFLVRRVVRLNMARDRRTARMTSPSAVSLSFLLPDSPSTTQLHETLLAWYERLPHPFRIFNDLGVLSLNVTQHDLEAACTLTATERMSPRSVSLNLLFFTALVLLHEHEARTANMNSPSASAATPSTPPSVHRHPNIYRLSPANAQQPALPVPSISIIAAAYRAQCFILRRLYTTTPPLQSTMTPPPPELVCTPLLHCYISPAPTLLLSHREYAVSLTALGALSAAARQGSALAPLESVVLPVLDHVSCVWAGASVYAANLRGLVEVWRARERERRASVASAVVGGGGRSSRSGSVSGDVMRRGSTVGSGVGVGLPGAGTETGGGSGIGWMGF